MGTIYRKSEIQTHGEEGGASRLDGQHWVDIPVKKQHLNWKFVSLSHDWTSQ